MVDLVRKPCLTSSFRFGSGKCARSSGLGEIGAQATARPVAFAGSVRHGDESHSVPG